jgi:hypothetical protein
VPVDVVVTFQQSHCVGRFVYFSWARDGDSAALGLRPRV